MIHKDNIKLYIKEKSTLIASSIYLVFLVIFLISFLPFTTKLKGVRNTFSGEEIRFITSNRYNTTYLVSEENNLYYSFNKNHLSHLNSYAGIKDLSNAYGDPTNHLYNFIKIDYTFESNIKDVIGLTDNADGQNGYTLILLENGDVYHLSTTYNKMNLLLQNVKNIKNTYRHLLVETTQNQLYYYYMNTNYLTLCDLNLSNQKDYFVQGSKEGENATVNVYSISPTNELKKMQIEYKVESAKEDNLIHSSKLLFPIEDITTKAIKELSDTSIHNARQIASVDASAIVLTTQNEFYGIDNENHIFSPQEYSKIEASFDSIDQFYTCGEFAYLVNANKKWYYLGNIGMKNAEINYQSFIPLSIKCDAFYGSSNIVMYVENGYIYQYDEDTSSFSILYLNYLTIYVIRYFSLFVILMLTLYFILSFLEANERYNRYFNESRKQKEKY